MYPTKEEFQELLNSHTLDWIIDNHVFGGVPFFSLNAPEVHNSMIQTISRGLKVPKSDICVIGSARIGYSLSPERFGQQFNEFSDIDICVVSESLFDPSWLDMLDKYRMKGIALNQQTKRNLQVHRESHYIYNGWIYPGSVVQVLSIGELWLRTFNGLSRISELASRNVGGRLYRTWDHVRHYHRWSLGKVKDRVFSLRKA